PCAGFITAGVVTYLKVADLTIGVIDQADDIPLVALYMIHVEQDLTGWAVDGPADGIGLIGVPEKEVRSIAQRLQHHDDLVRLQYLHAPAKGVDDVACLHSHGQVSFEVAGHHGGQHAATPLGYFYCFPASFQEYFYELRLAG